MVFNMKCLVVLSHLMLGSCELGLESVNRTNLAIDTFKAGHFGFLLTIGWAYRSDSNTPISDVARDYIINNTNIDSSSIVSISGSRDIVGDAYFCLQFAQHKNIKELVVVTSDYHVSRTTMIFKKLFEGHVKIAVTGVKTGSMHDPTIIAHEEQSIDAFNRTFANTDFSKISALESTTLALKARGPSRTPLDTGSSVLDPAPRCFQFGQATQSPVTHWSHTL